MVTIRTFLILGVAFLSPVSPILADIVHLKNGKTIEGRVIEEGFSYVRIETDKGEVEVDRDEVDRIERKPWSPPPKKGSAPAPGTPPPPTPAVRLEVSYREAINNYRINFPKGWERGSPPEGFLASFAGPRQGGVQPTILLRIERNDLPLKDWMARHAEAEKLEPKEHQDLKLGSSPAKKFTADAGEARLLRVVVDDGAGRKFIATFSAPAEAFETLRRPVESAMLSLRVFPENPLTPERKAEYLDLAKQVEQALAAKNTKEAVRLLDKCRDYIPNYPDLYNAYATGYSYEHNWKKAADYLQQAVKLDPDCYEYRYYLSNFLLAISKSAEAEKHAIKATEIDPWSESAWVNLGIVHLRRSLYPKARAAFEHALQINPKSAPAYYNLGVLHEVQGQRAAAIDAYRKALEIEPSNATIQQALERVTSGK